MAHKKGFPDEMLVHREDAGDGTKFFVADPELRAHADLDEEVEVAIYTLDRVDKLRAKLEMK
jgi:hypothetical protein